jgi:hypothetical protein
MLAFPRKTCRGWSILFAIASLCVLGVGCCDPSTKIMLREKKRVHLYMSKLETYFSEMTFALMFEWDKSLGEFIVSYK